MPTLLQINATANWGSTGKIAEQIGKLAISKGWESYIAYGRNCNPSESKLIRIGSKYDVYEHYFENRFLDNEGLASRRATKAFVDRIIAIKPDIIHIHNIHDHYLNYRILFEYLRTLTIPIVWTQHDCWAYTGGCTYYSTKGCYDWMVGCDVCPRRKGYFFDKCSMHYRLKKELFCSLKNLTIVPVSEWLEGEVKKSFFSDKKIKTILNGIDINTFAPVKIDDICGKYNFGDKHVLFAVASVWHARKGLDDYIKLSGILDDDKILVLIGLSENQSKNLPNNIIAIPRTQNVNELVSLYNEASIVLNLSHEETFGLTTAEGFGCGTPGIVYNCTASTELITPETGLIVEEGDVNGVKRAIDELIIRGKSSMSKACRERAEEKYDKNKCFEEYMKLYDRLLSINHIKNT